jgi:hypothetical protein
LPVCYNYLHCLFLFFSSFGLGSLGIYDRKAMEKKIENAFMIDEFYGGDNRKLTTKQHAQNMVDRLNDEQRAIYEKIIASIQGKSKQHYYLVIGSAGVGMINFLCI